MTGTQKAMMRKIIWTLFLTLTLIWTTFAFLAAGLARWASDAIASDLWAETTRYVAHTSEQVTQRLTDATVRVAEQVATRATHPVGEEQQPVGGATAAAAAPVDPILPPLPEWVNQWLAPETVQSIKEWGIAANSAANAGKAAVADAANSSANSVLEALKEDLPTNSAGDLEVEASHPEEAADLHSAELNPETDMAGAPWLADLVGWLVPVVWVIWALGLIIGLLLTLIAQWGASQLIGSPLLKQTSPR